LDIAEGWPAISSGPLPRLPIAPRRRWTELTSDEAAVASTL